MTKEIHIDILRPFGPRILKATVPDIMMNALNDQCDKLLENKLFSLTKALYVNFLSERNMSEKEKEDAGRLAIHNSWFVRSFENDYNPTHIHTNGSFSCVLYLKVPEGISDKNSKNVNETYATEGYIDFVYGSSSIVNPGNMCVQPKVGELFIFPSHLFHTVYPFYGKGERRSFSSNMSLQKVE